ncbi:hypothetical protein Avbf_07331 [Armadillidium vulgare]|nr:hypothetical protein Avbf_07331 [Armadillidium vulgare]
MVHHRAYCADPLRKHKRKIYKYFRKLTGNYLYGEIRSIKREYGIVPEVPSMSKDVCTIPRTGQFHRFVSKNTEELMVYLFSSSSKGESQRIIHTPGDTVHDAVKYYSSYRHRKQVTFANDLKITEFITWILQENCD